MSAIVARRVATATIARCEGFWPVICSGRWSTFRLLQLNFARVTTVMHNVSQHMCQGVVQGGYCGLGCVCVESLTNEWGVFVLITGPSEWWFCVSMYYSPTDDLELYVAYLGMGAG